MVQHLNLTELKTIKNKNLSIAIIYTYITNLVL